MNLHRRQHLHRVVAGAAASVTDICAQWQSPACAACVGKRVSLGWRERSLSEHARWLANAGLSLGSMRETGAKRSVLEA